MHTNIFPKFERKAFNRDLRYFIKLRFSSNIQTKNISTSIQKTFRVNKTRDILRVGKHT